MQPLRLQIPTVRSGPGTLRVGEIGVVNGSGKLRAILGSCIAVALFHPEQSTATMAHVLLPSGAGQKDALVNPGKYADSAVEVLVHLLRGKGLSLNGVVAKVAGGANMFAEIKTEMMARIGTENDCMVLNRLRAHDIPITGRHTGGYEGRIVEFDVAAGTMSVQMNGGSTTHI